MRKLLRANFIRLKKTKVFWGGMAVLAATGLLLLVNSYCQAVKYSLPLPAIFASNIYQSTVLMGIVFAVFCSLYVGTEYDHGTIRNKLMIGQSRNSIYLSNAVCCMTAGFLQAAAAVLIVLAVGFLLAGRPDMGAGHFCQVGIVMVFTCVAYMSVYNMFSMLFASKAYAAVVNILLAFAFLMLASYLFSKLEQPEMITDYICTAEGVWQTGDKVPNPHYIAGMQRKVFQVLSDFLPGGQTYQIGNYGMHERLLQHPAILCCYSTVVTIVTNGIGLFIFHKKDIK